MPKKKFNTDDIDPQYKSGSKAKFIKNKFGVNTDALPYPDDWDMGGRADFDHPDLTEEAKLAYTFHRRTQKMYGTAVARSRNMVSRLKFLVAIVVALMIIAGALLPVVLINSQDGVINFGIDQSTLSASAICDGDPLCENVEKIELIMTRDPLDNITDLADIEGSYHTQVINNPKITEEYNILVPKNHYLSGVKITNRTENIIEESSTATNILYSNVSYPNQIGYMYEQTFGCSVPYNYTAEADGGVYFYNFSIDPSQTLVANTTVETKYLQLNASSADVKRGVVLSHSDYEDTWEEDSVSHRLESVVSSGFASVHHKKYIQVAYYFTLPLGMNPYMFTELNITTNAYYSRSLDYGKIILTDGSDKEWNYAYTSQSMHTYSVSNPVDYFDFSSHEFCVEFKAYNYPDGFQYDNDFLELSLEYAENITTYTMEGEQINLFVNSTCALSEMFDFSGIGLGGDVVNFNISNTMDITNKEAYFYENTSTIIEEESAGIRVTNTISLEILIGNSIFNMTIDVIIEVITDIILVQNSMILKIDDVFISHTPIDLTLEDFDFAALSITVEVGYGSLLIHLWEIITKPEDYWD